MMDISVSGYFLSSFYFLLFLDSWAPVFGHLVLGGAATLEGCRYSGGGALLKEVSPWRWSLWSMAWPCFLPGLCFLNYPRGSP